ncbi:unnamed protein product [Prorocentrum cordatum]|uniref:Uncharacterized protein n=1 Tax=Prorocentrum cordatum TaxID=2364126 RepID=A0ABN9Q529_9DINO|nr:unnamed protein product [Polarella glacialis]
MHLEGEKPYTQAPRRLLGSAPDRPGGASGADPRIGAELHQFNSVNTVVPSSSIAICAFMQLLVAHLGGVGRLTSELSLDSCRHVIPVRWFVPEWSWTPQKRFVRRTVGAVLLYVPVTLTVAVVVLVSSLVYFPLFKVLHWPFISVVNVMLFIAMYGLVLFYHANQARLAPLSPIKKILSIKILLFFTFWQGVVVSVLHRLHYLDGLALHSRPGPDPIRFPLSDCGSAQIFIPSRFLR